MSQHSKPHQGVDVPRWNGPDRPRLERRKEDSWLAGVASAIARHLDLPAWLVRSVFVALMTINFLGLPLYGVLWVLIPTEGKAAEAPGLEAANRLGMRKRTSKKRSTDYAALGAVALIGFGVVWLVQASGLGVSSPVFIPLLLAALGIAIVWRAADMPSQTDNPDTPRLLRPFVSRGRPAAALRITVGLALVGLGAGIIVSTSLKVDQLPAVLLLSLFLIVTAAVVAAPWLNKWRHSLEQARDEKLVADTRADMAAHLHDSVLQTLALIQRQADNPKAVAQLARRQERELRKWLYGESADHSTLKAALSSIAAEVEDEWSVNIEPVLVGDTSMTPELANMVQAAREALVNAAKHSGESEISLYSEVDDDVVEIFVRDRGVGFDLDEIAEDRMGVRGSLIERMERHGGRAVIRTAPGDGTEVRLEMKR